MMYQMNTPYHQHNLNQMQMNNLGQMQMNNFQPMYTEQFAQQHQSIQYVSSNIVPVNTLDAMPAPLPMTLTNPMISSTVMNSRPLYQQQQSPYVNPGSDPYCCNFLGQLVGSYKTDRAEQIQIVLAAKGGQQYAVVRRVCSGAEAVPDQLIYEDVRRFTLCSLDGYVEAVMLKGTNMKHNLTWYTNNGTWVVWMRMGEVVFKLVNTPHLSQRNSITSDSGTCTSVGLSEVASTDLSMRIRPELAQSNEQSENDKAQAIDSTYTAEKSTQSCLSSNSQFDQRLSEDELLDMFQVNCRKDPSLLQKVLHWGISRTPNHRVGEKEISELGSGRVWVSASLVQTNKEDLEKLQDVLDELKGAYQEVSAGVYSQPPPQENEPGMQHRLLKSNIGLWMIEEYNREGDVWSPCIQELPYGHWVDLKNNWKLYRVQIVPMCSILSKMQEEWTDFEEMEKSLEFLFTSCNQKKLNTKLKARNLKHNIVNLKMKLEKQYSLSFAVRVANIADSIALGEQKVG